MYNVSSTDVGGSVTAGLGIYDTMQYVLPPVATWCVGQAASMASLLLTAGSPGMRHSLPNSRIMIHQPSGHAVVRSLSLLISKSQACSEISSTIRCDDIFVCYKADG